MKTWFSLILCFAVAFQGAVWAHAVEMPCPMGTAGAQEEHDCCDQAPVAAEVSVLCKSDVRCGGVMNFTVPLFLSLPLPVFESLDDWPAEPLPSVSFLPSSVWRPPSAH